MLYFFKLFENQNDIEIGRENLPFVDSSPKYQQSPCLGSLKSWTWNFSQSSPMGRNPSMWATICCLLGKSTGNWTGRGTARARALMWGVAVKICSLTSFATIPTPLCLACNFFIVYSLLENYSHLKVRTGWYMEKLRDAMMAAARSVGEAWNRFLLVALRRLQASCHLHHRFPNCGAMHYWRWCHMCWGPLWWPWKSDVVSPELFLLSNFKVEGDKSLCPDRVLVKDLASDWCLKPVAAQEWMDHEWGLFLFHTISLPCGCINGCDFPTHRATAALCDSFILYSCLSSWISWEEDSFNCLNECVYAQSQSTRYSGPFHVLSWPVCHTGHIRVLPWPTHHSECICVLLWRPRVEIETVVDKVVLTV